VPPELAKSHGLVLNSKAHVHDEYKLLFFQWDLHVRLSEVRQVVALSTAQPVQ